MIQPSATLSVPPHNLGLYRLEGFSGYRRELLQLHEWMTGRDDLPAIAISGDQGNGKTSLATAAGWNHLRHFTDGVIRVSAAGANRFRLYDVVRTLDGVLGTALTRVAEERWGISILEQLYRRKRLLIVDKLAGATDDETNILVNIIGHLHESAGNSRIMLIDRNFGPAIAELVQFQHIQLTGLAHADLPEFIEKRAPPLAKATALAHWDDLYRLTAGRPLNLRLILGMLLDYRWAELAELLQDSCNKSGQVQAQSLASFAVEHFASANPQVGPFLDRLVSAAGGATFIALRELFWADLGTESELRQTIHQLVERGLLEQDSLRQRVVLHPLIRSHLEENAILLGQEWERTHARYYVRLAQQYPTLPLQRWPEVDTEWGNIQRGADWCARRVQALWPQPPKEVLQDPAIDQQRLTIPAPQAINTGDLQLMHDYALALAHYAFWRHPPSVQEWLMGGALAALALSNMRDYAWFQMNIGRQSFFTGAVDEGIRWLERAEAIFDQRDLLMELAYVLTDLGTSHRVRKDVRRALAYFRAAFDAVAQSGNAEAQATAYMNLGSAYYSTGRFDDALHEQRKALRVAVRREEPHLIASAYNNIGLTLEAMDQLVEAQQAYEAALAVFRRTEDVIGISACYNNLGSVSYARNQYGMALMWYELDLSLSAKRGAWTDMAATLHNLGHVALEMSEHERALAYFQQSRELYAAFQLDEYVQEEAEMIAYIERSLAQS